MARLKSTNPYDTSHGPDVTGGAPLAIPSPAPGRRSSGTPAPLGMQRATINVDPDQWRRFRVIATQRGVSASDLLREFMAATIRGAGG
jgi:hypothetical protein